MAPAPDEPTPVAGAAGFPDGAVYEAGRPGYPDDAVAFIVAGLGIGPGRIVFDLGAGTGKFTRLLTRTGARVLGAEPSASMRAELSRRCPDAEVLAAVGEDLPVADGTVDAVTVAQAFHWFDAGRALAEIARVLRPGGGLALVWNERDESVPWVRQLSAAMRWPECRPYPAGRDYRRTVLEHPDFTDGEHRRFHLVEQTDHDRLRQRVLSTSYIAAAPDRERARLQAAVDEVITTLPEPVELPHLTDAYVFHTAAPG